MDELRNSALNLVGLQVRKFRAKRGWTQEFLAQKLQLQGWSISRESLARLELQDRRVPDCELVFLAKVLGVALPDLFPKNMKLRELGPQFQTGGRLSVFPMRGDKSG